MQSYLEDHDGVSLAKAGRNDAKRGKVSRNQKPDNRNSLLFSISLVLSSGESDLVLDSHLRSY